MNRFFRVLRYQEVMVAMIMLIVVCIMGNAFAQVNPGKGVSTAPAFSTTKNTPSTHSAASTRVVATVNGQEITVADINVITAQSLRGVTDPNAIARVKYQALNDVINSYLASAEFNADAASQNPENIKQLEHLKRQVLMNFYLSTKVADIPKPDQRQIEDYLQKHPELYSARQTFHFSEMLIDASQLVRLDQVQDLVNQDPSLKKLAVWLDEHHIPYVSDTYWKSTDQLNLGAAATFKGLKKNTISVEESSDHKGIVVIKLYDSYPDPVTQEKARAILSAGVQEEMRNRVASDLLAKLRSKADIQIKDPEFAKPDPIASTSAKVVLDETKITLSTKVLVIWVFSLLVLGPAALVAFYRHQISIAAGENLPPETTQYSEFLKYTSAADEGLPLEAIPDAEFLKYRSRRKIIRRLVVIPILAILTYWLGRSVFQFFLNPPLGVGIRNMAMLAMLGLVLASLVVIACMKLPKLRQLMKNGWIGLLLVVGIQLIFL